MGEQIIKQNQLRILRTCHQQIYNLIKLGRYTEAEHRSRIMAGILRVWELDKDNRQSAALKQSRPAIA